MTTPVSQVRYWLTGTTANGNASTKEGAEGATYLSYDVLLGLSVLGGFFALDHLYLRSPTTFLAKFVVNIFTFGVWWLYDATQVVFNRDVVKLYGLSIPGWGPTGIGAGVLAKEVPDKKHMRFLLYSVALFFGGLIGLDSFVVGDRQTGIIRLLSALSFIFLPLALLWWGYELFQYFTNLEEVIGTHHEFFGAPSRSLASRLGQRFPLLGWLFSPLETIKNLVNNIFGPALIQPLTKTVDSAVGTVEHAVSTVDDTVQLGREALSKSGEIIDQVGKTLEVVSQASTMMPAASLYAAAQEGLKSPPQSGGGGLAPTALNEENLNPLGFMVLGTLALITLSGFVVTWYRTQNVSREQPGTDAQRDDAPPQPGVLRGAD
jgi:TM2 domain-containing membrane protein YozV